MIGEVQDLFKNIEMRVDHFIAKRPEHHPWPELNSSWIKKVAQDCQVFDCNGISDQVIGDGSFEQEMYPDAEVPPSVDVRLPSKTSVVAFNTDKLSKARGVAMPQVADGDLQAAVEEARAWGRGYGERIYVLSQVGDDPSFFEVIALGKHHSPTKVGFIGGKRNWSIDVKLYERSKHDKPFIEAVAGSLRRIACLLQTINTPRFVKVDKEGTRQARRSAHRGGGFAMDAWHKVSWDVDAPVNAKTPVDKGYHKLPLHFRRGHWRDSKQTDPKSVFRNGHWKTWIEGYWAGHPAFGFKKTYHSPKKGK